MEFLRLGGTIPGRYWGCCAVSVIQNFKVDPDTPWSSQIQSGDSGLPCNHPQTGAHMFVGPTYKDIFLARLRIGEFTSRDMPSHTFLAILTESQCNGGVGQKWLALLREQGFEFLRTVDNSVYGGDALYQEGVRGTPHKNYIFALFRNIGRNSVPDQFTPPKAWTDLPKVKEEAWEWLFDAHGDASQAEQAEAFTAKQREQDLALWEALGPPKFLTEEEVVEAGAPVILCGLRDPEGLNAKITKSMPEVYVSVPAAYLPEPKADREAKLALNAPPVEEGEHVLEASVAIEQQADPFQPIG